MRYLSIRDEARAREQRRHLWLLLIDERDIADLSTFGKWESSGLDPRMAVGPWDACQNLGDELRDAGYRGVQSPSAALPGAVNLTLFGERYEYIVDGDLTAWANPDPESWVACQRAAEHTGPPVALISRTCFEGAPHLGYRRWLRAKRRPLPPGAP